MNTIFKNVELNNKVTDITVCDGRIISIEKTGENGFDCEGLKAYPGLIDVHIHGCGGFDTMDGDKLCEMSQLLASQGVTAWFPTTMTAPHQRLKEITGVDMDFDDGAQICGFHLEGPYLSPKYAGAQLAEYMQSPNIESFNQLKNVKMVTIAPELEGSCEFIEQCNAVVSLGHTACTYNQAIEAFEKGAACLTHTFNAMPPLHHREPSLIGAAMDKGAYAQLICDGVHVHPSAVRMLYKTFGADRVVLISDSTRASCMPDGIYELGGQTIIVKGDKATCEDGTIAGSRVLLGDCVKKAVEFGIAKEDAIRMATETPARMMGLNKGKIAAGCDCDIILTDDDYALKYTIVNGKIVWRG